MYQYCPDMEPKRGGELGLLKFLVISAHNEYAQLDEWGELINNDKKSNTINKWTSIELNNEKKICKHNKH